MTIFWALVPGYLFVEKCKVKKNTILAIACTSVIASAAFGTYRLQQNPTEYHDDIQIKVVQANIRQSDKWNPQKYNENFQTYLRLSEKQPSEPDIATLVIWPETATGDYFLPYGTFESQLKNSLKTYRQSFLISGYLQITDPNENDSEEGFKNSLIAFDQQLDKISSYDKSHLVPFGEYIPFQKYIPLAPVTNFRGLIPGEKPHDMQVTQNLSFIPLVCYEVIFPKLSSRRNCQKNNDLQLIINVTNDAWYGQSTGPYQHLSITRFRAIEQGLPLVRSANTGISAIIDSYGRVQKRIGLQKQGVIKNPLPKKTSEITSYSCYIGTMYLIFLAILSIMILISFSKNNVLTKIE